MNHVVVYAGRFHPFHKGHAYVYKTLVNKFGAQNVYIATSGKVDPPKSPFTFEEKKKMMMHAGVPATAIVQCSQPYRPIEILDSYNSDNTILLFGVGEKDMAEDPRFAFKPKKDGSPSYFQPAQPGGEGMKSFEEHGYIITVPTLQFDIVGKPMTGATEFRRNFANADEDTKKAMVADLYGTYSEEIYNIMNNKITEDKTQRLASILETVNEIKDQLSTEQLEEVYAKTSRLMFEMQLQKKRAVLESLYKLDKEDIMNSEVAVDGVGVYTVNGLMQNLSRKFEDLAKDAKTMTPYNYKNIKAKLDSGIITAMINSLTTAFADLERVRRKGGSNSRAIPKDMFDDVELTELQVTQRDALRVLYNVAARKDNKPFPMKMYNKDVVGNPNAPGAGVGKVEVTPHQARLITKFYDTGDSKRQANIERMLKTYGGWEQLLSMVESVQESWSQKYKDSIDCSNPQGFSQKAHCAGRKKKK